MLANRLKSARLAKGLRQVEVAKTLGVTQVFISRLEHGSKRPSVDMLAKLAKLYGVTETFLLGHTTREDAEGYGAGGTDGSVNSSMPSGLRELAADKELLKSLQVTPEEWLALGSIALPSPTDKAGYVQLLATIRGISRR